MDRIIGEMVNFKADRGFGFVKDMEGRSYFLHITNIKDQLIPRPGDLLTFGVRPNPKRPELTEAFEAIIIKRKSSEPTFVVAEEV